ncbi:hypothetical protein AXF42_Ash001292 [Apostasia shenzhenica]|uniref:Uncharacterized protein n=1 Tax=Apostasia shenzhenica TaxID=1088818 RepID=A0A2I0AUH9_9ASPA|nr:hypothetical protein AXF42_Ash001292 [Apostasia shenzhenica]
MAEDIFEGLPPPSAQFGSEEREQLVTPKTRDSSPAAAPPSASLPALKSALKRDRPPQSQEEAAPARQKQLRFKTVIDASEAQVLEAVKKIMSHIKNPSKFNKASNLAAQLIRAGSVKPENSDLFFALLDAAMSSPTACNEPLLRADYHALFSAVQDITQYSKAAGKIKDAISNLPIAAVEDDDEETQTLSDENAETSLDKNLIDTLSSSSEVNNEASDPFGLETLLASTGKKNEKIKGKEVATLNKRAEKEEHKRFIKARRETLLLCLEIAARRYKVPWCQTVIDILAKHAFDHKDRFTLRQREAIEKLWTSIKEQQIRRKQGKSVSGKLDMNAFEWLQEKYANEKISIRHSVGGGGERKAEQWLEHENTGAHLLLAWIQCVRREERTVRVGPFPEQELVGCVCRDPREDSPGHHPGQRVRSRGQRLHQGQRLRPPGQRSGSFQKAENPLQVSSRLF